MLASLRWSAILRRDLAVNVFRRTAFVRGATNSCIRQAIVTIWEDHNVEMRPVRVEVNDKMQKGYVYFRTKPMGKAFRAGFKPELTPKQMLELGVFGGKYMTDCREEFPASWFTRAKLSPQRPRASLNHFGVNASQPLSEWRRKGWIHPDDPRGWFQWYCRYYAGRRSEDDLRQIARWRAIRRHVAQLKKNCKPRDLTCRRRQRQALLHWAYDSRNF